MIKVCPKCGYQNDEDAIYCLQCLEDLKNVLPGEEVKINFTEFTGYNTNNMSPLGYSLQYEHYNDDISIGAWIGISIALGIPIINIIVLIWILTSSSTNRTLKNYAIAQFILMCIGIVLTGLLLLIR